MLDKSISLLMLDASFIGLPSIIIIVDPLLPPRILKDVNLPAEFWRITIPGTYLNISSKVDGLMAWICSCVIVAIPIPAFVEAIGTASPVTKIS